MKRIKMMLLSFALLAVVSGALAFKAKFGLQKYCSTTSQGNTQQCVLTDAKQTNQGTSISAKTTLAVEIDGVSTCSTFNGAGQLIPLTCSTPQWITTVE